MGVAKADPWRSRALSRGRETRAPRKEVARGTHQAGPTFAPWPAQESAGIFDMIHKRGSRKLRSAHRHPAGGGSTAALLGQPPGSGITGQVTSTWTPVTASTGCEPRCDQSPAIKRGLEAPSVSEAMGINHPIQSMLVLCRCRRQPPPFAGGRRASDRLESSHGWGRVRTRFAAPGPVWRVEAGKGLNPGRAPPPRLQGSSPCGKTCPPTRGQGSG